MSDRFSARLAYEAGARARVSGASHLEAPMAVSDPSYEHWLRGWGGQPDPEIEPHFIPLPKEQ